jgi:hypothetical protein
VIFMSNLPSGPPEPIPATALQILATEHWSLLATRSLTYSESFSRVGLFFTVLTGAIVALALLAQVEHFNQAFVSAALLILSTVFFVGLTTLGRVSDLNRDDIHWVAGMNRLRKAYLDMHPELESYFITDSHDDFRGVLTTMSIAAIPGRNTLADAVHGFTTLPAMLGIIEAVIGGVLGALVAGAFGASEWIAIAAGAAVFLVTNVILALMSMRAFVSFAKAHPARFPSA